MKEKKTITYIKNGTEVTKIINLFNKKEILDTIFEQYRLLSEGIELIIKEDVEYLLLKNICFSQNIKLLIPNTTIIILENCYFKGKKIDFKGGNIQLINPQFSSDLLNSYIHVDKVIDFNLILKSQNNINTTVRGQSNILTIDGNSSEISIIANAQEIILKNIQKTKELKITGAKVILANCSLDMDLYHDIKKINAQYLRIINSSLYYQSDKKVYLLADSMNLYDSDIYFYGFCDINGIIQCNQLTLKNSKIEAKNSIKVFCQKMLIDSDSSIVTGQNIMLNEDTYYPKNENNSLVLNTKKLSHRISEREFISVLKAFVDVKKKGLVKKI